MAQTPYPQTDRELIRRIECSAGSRAGYKQLIRELGLGGGRERRLLLEQLARITARGELVKTNNEQWSLPAAAPEKTARASRSPNLPPERRQTRDNLIAGRLDLHRDGFGFVRPEGATNRDSDLFIPPNEINGAMQGDQVLVDEAPPGRPGPDGNARRSGRIARVLTRRNPTVVGIFHYARTHRRTAWENAPLINGNYVTPLDERITQPILIPEGLELPAAPQDATPHRVLGDEARAGAFNWQDPALREPLEGLAVDVEITDFPLPGRPAKGRVIEVLGPPDGFGVDVEIVIRKHHIPHVFPANVLAEATASAAQTVEALPPEDLADREDFRALNIVTIDGETARDFDDAVHVHENEDGTWNLQVHIADVSHYVRPGTDLDLEARLRGTSVYFPDRAVPMLPPQLSSGMCSLRPDEDRLVLSCLMHIDPQGEVLSYRVAEGIIRSARRMTYTQVQAILDNESTEDQAIREEFLDLIPHFERMHTLALRLNAKRKRRGSIDFDLPEPVIRFDPDGNMASIVRSERGWSHRLIEEFMLSANECVAHWLEALAPSLYRIHEMPDPKRIVDFEDTAAAFGYSLGLTSLPVQRMTMKSDRRESQARGKGSARGQGSARPVRTHDIASAEIPVTPQMYQRLTAKIAGTPEERILAFLMLRSLKQARYSEQNVGHFALASPSYTHFTSPIRRYPDLIVHRLLRNLLEGGYDPNGGPIRSDDPQPWAAKAAAAAGKHPRHAPQPTHQAEPIPTEELAAIATESSQSERRADDAERELMEWKKIRFMQDRVGEDFSAIILSCTKYGFFVELDELFIEGLVPLASLEAFTPRKGSRTHHQDRFVFRDTDRQIVGTVSGQVFKMGMRVRVLLDRIDRQQRRLQFALLAIEGHEALPEKVDSPKLPRPKKIRQIKTSEKPNGSSGKPKGKKGRKRH